MNLMRGMLVGAIVLTLAACNRSSESEDSSVVQWAAIPADTITTPRGVTYEQVTIDGQTVAEISGVREDAAARGRTQGVSVRLPDAFEQQASGSQVRVTVRAMSPQEGAVLGVAYSTAEAGNSGWRQFTLSGEPRDYSFIYNVPRLREGKGDFLGFRSYGENVVRVVSYSVEVEGPATRSRPAPAAQPATATEQQPATATDELRP